MEEIEIVSVSNEDINDILTIQSQNHIKNVESVDFWFLVHEMDRAYLDELIQSKTSLIEIAKIHDHVVGYLVAYDLDRQDKEWRDSISFHKDFDQMLLHTNKILYAKHIAIKKWFASKWIGTILEDHCFQKARDQWYTHILWEIAQSINKDGKKVKNDFSMKYHRKKWFDEIGELTYTAGAEKEFRSLIVLKL